MAVLGALVAVGLIAAVGVAQARAATTVYPAGGSTFSGGAEGWKVVGEPTCTLPLVGVCSASVGYDGASGKPAGSLAVDTQVLVNVLGLLSSSAVVESPNFLATQGGAGAISLERAIASSGPLDLTPTVDYELTLLNRTKGTSSTVLSGTASGSAVPFSGTSGAVGIVEGHTYALSLAVDTSSQIVSLGLLGGTSAKFDNIELTVGSSGGDGTGDGAGGGAGAGAGGKGGAAVLTSRQLRRMIRSSLVGTARLQGKRLFVRARCPKRIGRACRVSVQGLLRKGRAATTRRSVRIGKGQTRRVVLRVKPKARARVRQRKRLLVRQTVRAGGARVTVHKRLRLIRR